MIAFNQLTVRRGGRILIENINWTLFQGQHIGLTGANGTGKSSLFALLRGDLQADDGEVTIPSGLKIAHVAQEMPATTQTALEFVLDGDTALRDAHRQLEEALEKDDGMGVATAHETLMALDAWTAPARGASLLAGLGFEPAEIDRPVSAFSGGWQMRLLLAQALMCPSDALLLDEPTNHLDLDAVIWLTRWLKNYPGMLLLISHDREFLDETVQYTAHIEHQALSVCTGNYSDFEKFRAEKRKQQGAAFQKQQLKMAHLQKFVDRFRAKASKARQAQSRLKALDRLEVIAAVQDDNPFTFQFQEPDSCPHPLLQLEGVTLAYGDQVVLRDVYFGVTPGDRIALIGPNGAGKSTLIKALASDLLPSSGDCTAARGLKVGYFTQHHAEHLVSEESPLQHLAKMAPELSERELRGWLGSFGFSGDRVYEPVKIFSGGEKSRLALSLIIRQKPNLLLLDEPTNHLDMDMRDALCFALQSFKGAVVLVSHDRFLIRSTMDKLVLVADGVASEFAGDLNNYESRLSEFRRAVVPVEKVNKKKETVRNNVRDVARLEKEMTALQADVAQQEAKLAEIASSKDRQMIIKETEAFERMQAALRSAEEAWLLACGD